VNFRATKEHSTAFIVFFAAINFSCHGQIATDHVKLGRHNAELELKAALKDSISKNVVSPGEIIIKDSLTAINIAEPLLFGIYGKSNIIEQRPYEVHHINHYWLVNGTLPQTMLGGTFLIIIDDKNCKILKIIHGK
jgi:hypothetical protein